MKKKLAKLLACALAGTMIAFAGCGKNDDQANNAPGFDEVQTETPLLEDYDGQLVEDGKSYALSDKIAFMNTTSARSTTTGTEFIPVEVELVATVEPADANQEVIWASEFVDPTEEWAVGKTASDYVAIATNASGSTTATVTCKKPFAAQIKIVCTSAENAAISAECVVDFVRAIKEITVSWGDIDINFGGQTDVYWEVNPNGQGYGGTMVYHYDFYEDYTIDASIDIPRFRLNSPEGFFSDFGYSVDDAWGEFSTSKYTSNNHNDGYFVIGGYDFSIPSAAQKYSLYQYGDSGEYSFYYFTDETTKQPKMDLDYGDFACYTYMGDVWTSITSIDPAELITMSIDNGYLWTFSLFYTIDNSITVCYGSSLINLAGFTNNPLVQSVTLSNTSYQF